jgi:predicted RNA binding protein YcfA (HicA-like mRNA interferase family)
MKSWHMPKLPRDIDGRTLAGMLGKFGYIIARQTGSHIRLTREFKGSSFHITIPAHSPLKVGTLNAITSEVAEQLKVEKNELIAALF